MTVIRQLIAMIAVCVSLFTGHAGEEPAKDQRSCSLSVTTSSWSGWDADYEPIEATHTYTAAALESIAIPPEKDGPEKDGFAIQILAIDMNSVTLKTEYPMAPMGKQGINLMTDLTVFTVYNGQTLTLVTPTTDYGDIYIIEVLEIRRN